MKPREGSSAQIREGQDFLGGDQMPAAIYFGKGKSMRRGKTRDVVGRPSCRSSFLGDPGAKFLCGKLEIGTKKEKRSKKKKGRWELCEVVFNPRWESAFFADSQQQG